MSNPFSKIWEVGGTANRNAPGAGSDAVVTYGAVSGKYHVLKGIWGGYSVDDPAAGKQLKVESPSGTILWSVPIEKKGAAPIPFPEPGLVGAKGAAMIITLEDGTGTSEAEITCMKITV